MRRWLASILVSAGLLGGFLVASPPAAAASTSSCYDPSSNTYVSAPLPTGTSTLSPLASTTSSTSFGTQEGAWQTSSSTTGTCAEHDYVVLQAGDTSILYVDPPCTATVWGD